MSCNCDEVKNLQLIQNQKIEELTALINSLKQEINELKQELNQTIDLDITDAVRQVFGV